MWEYVYKILFKIIQEGRIQDLKLVIEGHLLLLRNWTEEKWEHTILIHIEDILSLWLVYKYMSHTLFRIAFSVKLWYQLREAYDLVRTPHGKGVGIWAHIWGEEKGLRIESYGFSLDVLEMMVTWFYIIRSNTNFLTRSCIFKYLFAQNRSKNQRHWNRVSC